MGSFFRHLLGGAGVVGIPTNPVLLADWNPTEGSGSTVFDKTGNGHHVTLGSGGYDPGWSGPPKEALGPFGSAGFLLNKYAYNADLPWNAGGGANDLRRMSMFLFLHAPNPAGSEWIIRQAAGASNFSMLFSGGKVRFARFSTPTSTNNIVDSTAAITAGRQFTLCCTNGMLVGEYVRLYLDGALDNQTAIVTSNIVQNASQPQFDWGSGNGGGFTSSPGFPGGYIGRVLVFDGELSAAQVAAIHTVYKTQYPALP